MKHRPWVGLVTALPFCFVLSTVDVLAQVSLLPADHPAYPWLHRQRVLGNVSGFSSEAQPLSRGKVVDALREVERHDERLWLADDDLLRSYLRELAVPGSPEYPAESVLRGEGTWRERIPRILRDYGEPHLYAFADSGYSYVVDAFLGAGIVKGDEGQGSFSDRLVERGVRAYGSFYGRLGAHVEVARLSSGEPVGVRQDPRYDKTFEVARQGRSNGVRFEAAASFEYGVFSAHAAHASLRYGPGSEPSVFLSRDAPTFDWVRLNLDAHRFRYTALLGSLTADGKDGVIIIEDDTVATRHATERRFVMHRLDVMPTAGLQLGLSEAVVYSARPRDYAYLNPFGPALFSERDDEDRDNVVLMVDATWRPLRGVEVYGSLLADDLQGLGDLFAGDTGRENLDRAYDVGATAALPAGVDLSVRWLRIEPFVYTHWQALNAFQQRDFSLGHPLGPNADSRSARLQLWLPRRSRLAVSYARIRKGLNPVDEDGRVIRNVGGDLLDGSGNTGFRFLEGADVQEYREVGVTADFEPWRGIRLSARYLRRDVLGGTRIADRDLLDVRVGLGF